MDQALKYWRNQPGKKGPWVICLKPREWPEVLGKITVNYTWAKPLLRIAQVFVCE